MQNNALIKVGEFTGITSVFLQDKAVFNALPFQEANPGPESLFSRAKVTGSDHQSIIIFYYKEQETTNDRLKSDGNDHQG